MVEIIKRDLRQEMAINSKNKIRKRIMKDIFYKSKFQEELNDHLIIEISKLIEPPIDSAMASKIELLQNLAKTLLNYYCVPKDCVDETDLKNIL